jgi:hypothetical protein
MEMQSVIKVIAIFNLLLCAFSTKDQEEVFIKFDKPKTITLDENYCIKNVSENKIVFAFGIETLGEINEFTFRNGIEQKREVSEQESQSLKFSTISQLNKILITKGKFDQPNTVFRNVNIVENIGGKIIIYKVCWKKILYEE